MYYTTLQTSQIWAANLDGSNPQLIVTAGAATWAEVRNMAVYGGILYWWTGSDDGAMSMYQVSIPALTTRPSPATPQMLQVGGAYLAVSPQ
jgi:hypothetical protein